MKEINSINSLKIAIQSKGRLYDDSMNFLSSAGFIFPQKERKLILPCNNWPLELIHLRSDDISEYVSRGVADFGIVGENVLLEKKMPVKLIKKLNFGKCSLVIAVPKSSSIKSVQDLEGERIATSYPYILKNFLHQQGINAAVINIQGSCEITPLLNLADAIFDITQTGTTLLANNLQILTSVIDLEACLISSPFESSLKNNFLQKVNPTSTRLHHKNINFVHFSKNKRLI